MSSPQSLTRPDEATWIARVRDGDERALAEIFTAYHASLCGLAASYVGDAAQAEEIVQETFLAFWERRRTADIRSGVRVYLFAAVRNRALNVVRHAKYERALTLRSWDGDMPGMGRAPRETESMERATSAPWPAAWAIGPTRLSRSRSSDGRGSLPVSTALTFCHILVALCVLPSMDGKIEAHNQRSAAVWSSGGDQYDEIGRQIASALDHCVRRVDPRPGEQVLDVATGTGSTSRLVARRGATVTGVDIAPELIASAEARARREGLDIDYDLGDAERLPYPDGSFDGRRSPVRSMPSAGWSSAATSSRSTSGSTRTSALPCRADIS